jgi:thiamine biosynthesis lipoprotein
VGRWADVRLEPGRVLLPTGTAVDFGGIAKGWAADLASALTRRLPWVVIDAGGDVRLSGRTDDGALRVEVDDPDGSGVALSLDLHEGALATSSTAFRSWTQGAGRAHHIIDPETGRPAATPVVQATAWGPDCAEAEVRAKWALLGGEAVLNRFPVVLFMDDGRVLVNLDVATGGVRC